ncbi:MAG: ATP-binding protein [Chloroflexi bacterium]|nr:ATP-binding protein [Chloroflexota bacterium]MYE40050.1 ATP-binding protein [Chloroflexota bacterium]
MRYTPFDVDLFEATGSHLAGLTEVSEGWYVDYKSQAIRPRELAKSLSSFANRYGGWLFLGVKENSSNHTAESFPGIPDADVASVVEQVRDAAKDIVQPAVSYFHHSVSGPLPEISLPEGRSIIIVQIPEGASPPYVHSDGRIYVRTGDSSTPAYANDRATIDLLHRKADEKRALLDDFVYRSPEVSKGEDGTTFLHLAICSDPFQVLGHRYTGSFPEFSDLMGSRPLPFDNIYTSQSGFVARQAQGNERRKRIFTWEFSRKCNSFVTFPLPSLEVPSLNSLRTSREIKEWSQYFHGVEFASRLAVDDLQYSRVLNLNILVTMLMGMVARHRSLAAQARINGPFFLKARVENSWRVVPFLDTTEYISHIDKFGIPVVQDADIEAPLGNWPEGFIRIPEINWSPVEDEAILATSAGGIEAWVELLRALGIPGEVLSKNTNEILESANREVERHRGRLTGGSL